ncbi:unnamed protein product [Didymodactylos carnosus]|uniref:Non-homologous end-joining factor 1 n=1 Tax=Didymodactylos carnosus TaxID=1234261 RepID=A0A813V1F1_9BILA|nr:unnamed protein product [Didymodactylos carnosus]CAF1116254.1 unnamed protein product [Didymodactylos carnosus]CAF3625624.1 unnamed protein product [Didymodactylos carnosus]CAF3886685.1 unnamed protein product [Didymodactylos carnosus]
MSQIPFEDFTKSFQKSFEHESCIVVELKSSNLHLQNGGLSSSSSQNITNDFHHNQIVCQPHFTDTSYEIAFYDNGNAYYEKLTEQDILKRLKVLNPKIEFKNIKSALDRIHTMLSESTQQRDKNEIHLYLSTALVPNLLVELKGYIKDNYSFMYEFNCEFYEQNYVKQIILALGEREKRELELIRIIQAKDKELEDYRSQGTCQLQRSWLQTQSFNKEQFNRATRLNRESESVVRNPLEYAFNKDGQDLVECCLLRSEYLKGNNDYLVQSGQQKSGQQISPLKKTPQKRTQPQVKEDLEDLIEEERRRKELEKQLEHQKQLDAEAAKKKKKKLF